MQAKKFIISEELLDKIISAAYKDATLIDRIKIYFLTKKYPEVKKIYNEYFKTAMNVKNIPLYKFPESSLREVELKTIRVNKSFYLKPSYAFAFSFLLIAGLVAVLFYQDKKEEPVYSKSEIELAEKQVKESLAIVNRIFKKTENLIQEEVLPKRVGKPIHKSLSIINEVLIGG